MASIYSSILQDSWSLRVKEGPDFFSTDENKKKQTLPRVARFQFLKLVKVSCLVFLD